MKTIYDLDVFARIDELQGIDYAIMKANEETGISRVKARSVTPALTDEEVFNALEYELAKEDIKLLSYSSNENARTLTYQYADDLAVTPYAQSRTTTEANTTDTYTKLVCDWSNILVANANGDPISRFNYGFRIRITAYGRWVGTWNFGFHTNNHSAYYDVNLPSGGYSGTIATGTLDLGWYSTQAVHHTPGFACNLGGGNPSGSGVIGSTLTLPLPDLTASLESVTHDSATFRINLINKYNFYKTRIWLAGNWMNNNAPNGLVTVNNLTPETAYEFHIEAWNRTETESFKRQVIVRATTLADQATMRIKIDGLWKTGKVFIKVNDVWKKAKGVYNKENNEWKKGN